MKTTTNILLFYVLYLFLGNVSGVVPLVAGWRETKLKVPLDFGGKTAVFLSLLWNEYHCYSKCLALFCLEALDLQRQPSLTPAGQAVGGWVGAGWGGGSVHWVPLCCGPQVAAPQRSTSSWAPLDPPSVWLETQLLQHRPITALRHTRHLQRGEGRHHSTPAVVLPSPPSLSSLTQRSL